MSAQNRDRERDLNQRVQAAISLESVSSAESFVSAPLFGGRIGAEGNAGGSIEAMSGLGSSMSTLPSVSEFRTPAVSTHTLTSGGEDEGGIELSANHHHNQSTDDDDENEEEEEVAESMLGKPLVHVNMRETLLSTPPPPLVVTLTPPTPPVAGVGAVPGTAQEGISSAVSGAINGQPSTSPSTPPAGTRKQGPRTLETLAGQSVRVGGGLIGAGLPTPPAKQSPHDAQSQSQATGREVPGGNTSSRHGSPSIERGTDPQRRATGSPTALRSTIAADRVVSSPPAQNSSSLNPGARVVALSKQQSPPPPSGPNRPTVLTSASSKNRDEQQQRPLFAWEKRMIAGDEVAPGEVEVVYPQPGGPRAFSSEDLSELLQKPLLAVPEEDFEKEGSPSSDSVEVQIEPNTHVSPTNRQPSPIKKTGGPTEPTPSGFRLSTTTTTTTAIIPTNSTIAGAITDVKDSQSNGGAPDEEALAAAANSTGPEDEAPDEAKIRSGLEYLQMAARMTEARDALFRRARLVNDVSAVLAIVGLALAIAVQECIIADAFGGGGPAPGAGGAEAGGGGRPELNAGALVAMRSIVTASTAVLLALNIYFQKLVLKEKLLRKTIESVHTVVNLRWAANCAIELLVLMPHAVPVDHYVMQVVISKEPPFHKEEAINVNVFLTIAMFARLYLVWRSLLMHHPLNRTRVAQLFGPLNQVRVDYGFVFRTIMETKSGLVVCGILVAVAVTCSWALHACESGLQYQTRNVIEALWMIIITFTTVGYGDVYPSTMCGRVIAIFAALMGPVCIALMLAVITKFLNPSDPQRYLKKFVDRYNIQIKIKECSKDIVKQAWQLWKRRTALRIAESRAPGALEHWRAWAACVSAERQLMALIARSKELRKKRGRARDGNVTKSELARMQMLLQRALETLDDRLAEHVRRTEDTLTAILSRLPAHDSKPAQMPSAEGEGAPNRRVDSTSRADGEAEADTFIDAETGPIPKTEGNSQLSSIHNLSLRSG